MLWILNPTVHHCEPGGYSPRFSWICELNSLVSYRYFYSCTRTYQALYSISAFDNCEIVMAYSAFYCHPRSSSKWKDRTRSNNVYNQKPSCEMHCRFDLEIKDGFPLHSGTETDVQQGFTATSRLPIDSEDQIIRILRFKSFRLYTGYT